MLFWAISIALLSACRPHSDKSGNQVFVQEVSHLLYQKHPDAAFREADSLAYAQDYPRSELLFRQMLNSPLAPAERRYCLSRLADLNLRLYRDEQARQWLNTFDQENPDLKRLDMVEQGDAWLNRGRLAYRDFHPGVALHDLRLALATFREVYGEKHRCVAEALNMLGMVHYEFTRQSDSAMVYVEAARAIYLATPALQKLRRENELASGLVRLSNRDHEIGQAYAEVALSLCKEAPWLDTLFYARSLCLLGNMIKKQGRFDEADAYFREAIASTAGWKDVRRQEFYRDLIVNQIHRNNRPCFEAEMSALKQLLKEQKVDRYGHPDRLEGYWRYCHDNYAGAVQIYRRFLTQTDSLTNTMLLEEVAYVMADAFLHLAGSQNKAALLDSAANYVRFSFLFGTRHEGCRPPIDSLLMPEYYGQVDNPSVMLSFLGKALAEKYHKTAELNALWHSLEVFALVDSLLLPGVQSTAEGALLTFQFDVGDASYPEALAVALEAHRLQPTARRPLDLAFRFSERMKSYILFRDLGSRQRDSIGVLKKEIARLLSTRQARTEQSAALHLTAVVEQYEHILKQYRLQSEAYYSKSVLQTLPPLDTLQAHLDVSQAMVLYTLTPDYLYYLFVARDTAVLFREKATGLTTRLQEFHDSLAVAKSPGWERNYREQGWQLYLNLLGQARPLLGQYHELVIVPDRALCQIPFEALLTAPPDPKGPDGLCPYLLLQQRVSYTPAWKIWDRNRLGAATLPSKPRTLVFANSDPGFGLPYSVDEAESIRRCLGADHTDLLLDNDCTSLNFLARAVDTRYDILHLSLHAKSDLSDRNGNKIWFALTDSLYGFDLAEHPLQVRLVVLSACETALGKADAGEGAFSLSRCFLEAGARQVVATLWAVDNGDNARLMELFYEGVRENMGTEEALYWAKLKLAQDSEWVGIWGGVVDIR